MNATGGGLLAGLLLCIALGSGHWGIFRRHPIFCLLILCWAGYSAAYVVGGRRAADALLGSGWWVVGLLIGVAIMRGVSRRGRR